MSQKAPKAILFDIGGVCVRSPFQAILDYEHKNHIPPGWVNYAISRSAPNGYWQRLERGEIKLDAAYFKGFNADLVNADIWKEYHTKDSMSGNKKSLKELAKADPTHLGDPISLEAEAADSTTTDHDRGASSGAEAHHDNRKLSSAGSGKKRLKDLANPTQLGDPVSLKAEAADSSPTDQDRGANSGAELHQDSGKPSSSGSGEKKSLKEAAMANPTLLGDPVSLKAEAADSSPTEQDRGASSGAKAQKDAGKQLASGSSEKKSLKQLAMANPTLLGDPVSLKAEAADSTPTDQDRGALSTGTEATADRSKSSDKGSKSSIPPLPSIDAEALFWGMMVASREPDPYIFPALKKLKASKKFIIGALSNTVIYPPDHEYNTDRAEVRSQFDVFISSAHVGLRKPDSKIYDLAVKELDKLSKGRGGAGLEAGDIVFLDDIGENVKTGKAIGMQTIKVQLGATWKAVEELEKVTGLDLMDAEARRSKL
ncbi:epoxide [Lasallia pustulata]|uniref:Epoxide n=1 Tax=Lasallia pustulata TaxID=136370 RepID=A0A1W5DEQ6_9LECA|nr:epoxide [Lasallia pustulata]